MALGGEVARFWEEVRSLLGDKTCGNNFLCHLLGGAVGLPWPVVPFLVWFLGSWALLSERERCLWEGAVLGSSMFREEMVVVRSWRKEEVMRSRIQGIPPSQDQKTSSCGQREGWGRRTREAGRSLVTSTEMVIVEDSRESSLISLYIQLVVHLVMIRLVGGGSCARLSGCQRLVARSGGGEVREG